MAAGTPQIFNTFKEKMADGTLDMDTATADYWKCALLTSAYTYDATDSVWSDLSANEVSTTNTGYSAGGISLTVGDSGWSRSGGTVTFDSSTNPQWTAGSAGLTAKWAIIYGNNASTKDLVCAVDLNTDSGSATVSATTGNNLTITWNASGIFSIS
jgi:hypothetical protein